MTAAGRIAVADSKGTGGGERVATSPCRPRGRALRRNRVTKGKKPPAGLITSKQNNGQKNETHPWIAAGWVFGRRADATS
jgi:hypothetical protein